MCHGDSFLYAYPEESKDFFAKICHTGQKNASNLDKAMVYCSACIRAKVVVNHVIKITMKCRNHVNMFLRGRKTLIYARAGRKFPIRSYPDTYLTGSLQDEKLELFMDFPRTTFGGMHSVCPSRYGLFSSDMSSRIRKGKFALQYKNELDSVHSSEGNILGHISEITENWCVKLNTVMVLGSKNGKTNRTLITDYADR